MTISKEIIERVKDENPGVELTALEACGVEVIVRAPNPSEYEAFMTKLADAKPGKRLAVIGNLVKQVLVYPSVEQYDEVLSRMPGLSESLVEHVLEMAGLVKETSARKL